MERGEQRYMTISGDSAPGIGACHGLHGTGGAGLLCGKGRELLGTLPDRVEVEASGNIIKNVKSVIVPNTDGRKGIEAAAALVYWLATPPGSWRRFHR